MAEYKKNQALAPGKRLRGNVYSYTVEKVLGQGTFGITYLASTNMKGPLGEVTVQVALKEFFAKELDSRREDGSVSSRSEDGIAHKYAKAFQRESENLSKMKHPGIVNVLEAFETNGTYYYSMEYLSGGNLDDKVLGMGLPEAEALPLVTKVGEALSYMHERKMMHLDLKPKNIMLKGDGSPVIIDFGLSKQYDSEGEPESSSTIGLGTPGYAPLEQSNQTSGKEFQPTLDVYALGATLYKMLTGKTPPNASVILDDGFPEDALKAAGVSDATIAAIREAMCPVRKKRTSSASSFLSMLGNAPLGGGEETEEETTEKKFEPGPEVISVPKLESKPTPDSSGKSPAPKSKTWLWVLLGVIAAAMLAFVFFGGKKNGGDDVSVEQPCSVEITSEPAGAAIWLDDKDTKLKTPGVLKEVPPGTHAIRLVLDGYQECERIVYLSPGDADKFFYMLTAVPKHEVYPSNTNATTSSNMINGHEYMDLGLSVKWATCNVGASSPSDYGSYFAWGETEPKSDYSWSTLKYCLDSTHDSFSKYNTKSNYGAVDDKSRLDLSDDAARANWGGTWRMPTRAEQDELLNKCTWAFVSQGGKTGYKVTSRANGNSIFLPAAGNRDGMNFYGVGSHGYYWSSSLSPDHPYYAYLLNFYSGKVGWYYGGRYNGYPVRPVSD